MRAQIVYLNALLAFLTKTGLERRTANADIGIRYTTNP